ncbi:hypothetical protein ACFVHB_32180 [Kitasatospora sp. NPDC127111]|uniref:hypothetical protein n=1 Tax=Kitasatospora sp. NPDC127111 TaxID=3345363 RepID=UPI00363257BB
MVEVFLLEFAQRDAVLVEPGEELQRHQDTGAKERTWLGWAATLGGTSSGPSQQVPVRVRTDQLDVAGGPVDEDSVQPGRDAVEFLISLWEGAKVHKGVTDVMQVSTGR